MATKIFILTIPGIGTQKAGYSKKLKEDITDFAKGTPLARSFQVIEARPFSVTGIDKHQSELFKRLYNANKLGGIFSLREFVLKAFGDAVTFERNADAPDSPYKTIHSYLKEQIESVNEKMAAHKDSKLVIVAASMGVQVLSTYIWDADNGLGIFSKTPATAKNNLKNLSYLATIGCNLPLFVSGLPESKIKAFNKRNSKFTWDNFYDQDDVLGWPLKQMSASYNKLVTDYEINTGLYAGAHVKYWDDNDFTKPFVKSLLKLI